MKNIGNQAVIECCKGFLYGRVKHTESRGSKCLLHIFITLWSLILFPLSASLGHLIGFFDTLIINYLTLAPLKYRYISKVATGKNGITGINRTYLIY